MLHIKRLGVALAAVLALAACTDPNNPNRGMATGAATGAVVGGVLGNIMGATGRRTEATAIGAAIGAALGGGVGRAMDRQRQDFEQQLAVEQYRNEVQIQQLRRDVLMLTLDSELQFTTGSAVVQPGLRQTLQRIATVIRRYPGMQVAVVGHTDSTGSAEFNQRLSEQRANAVRNELVAMGVPQDQLFALGRGATEPRASNATADGRAANRRVELILTQPA
jgi:outer membrane protein OmpA-like peptidoglycan-associated protein